LLVFGLLIIVAGALPLWRAVDYQDDIRALEMEIYKTESDNAYRRLSPEEGEKKIAPIRQQIEQNERQRNVWYAAAGFPVLVGLALVVVSLLFPWSWKRAVPIAEAAPVESHKVPSPGGPPAGN